MTGSQLKHFRTSKGWSLRALADHLKDVNFSTLGRWEVADEEIPSWVEEKLMSSAEVTLPLDTLQQLMAYATRHQIDFSELLARALKAFLNPPKIVVKYSDIPPPETLKVAEDPPSES